MSQPEVLESRQVLSHGSAILLSIRGFPSDLPSATRSRIRGSCLDVSSLIGPINVNSPVMDNEGKIVSGTDRAGDKWTITVHGPGEVIVTDTTPNDGALDDDINTIQLVGTSPTSTYVTGQVCVDARRHDFDPPTAPCFSTSSSPHRASSRSSLNGFVLTQPGHAAP